MHLWIKQWQSVLIDLTNKDNAQQMKAYMRNQFEFYGIKSTSRREALKPFFTKTGLPDLNDLSEIVDQLWQLPQREYQLIAIDLLIKFKTRLPASILPLLEHWIITKSWWDTVDFLATHITGALYRTHPNECKKYIARWRKSENIWLRRTAILFQLKYKTETDSELLFSIIQENQHDREFFIQKAIGWSLREYSKSNANAVIHFIDDNSIDGLAKREGLKWLNNSGKH